MHEHMFIRQKRSVRGGSIPGTDIGVENSLTEH